VVVLTIGQLLRAIAVGMLGGCTSYGSPTNLPALPPAAAPTMLDLWTSPAIRLPQAGAHALVRSGTGVFVTHEGLLLTSAHVVAGCPVISVHRNGQVAGRAGLRAIDMGRQLALIATDLLTPYIAVPARGRRPSPAEPLFGLAFNVAAGQSPRPVLIRASFSGPAALHSGATAFMLRARVLPGASGGPIVDEGGALVGLVTGFDTDRPGLTVVVANSEAASFMAANDAPLAAVATRPRKRAAVEHLLTIATALVQCAPPRL
jgi:S1-C subfamily serine protease